MRHLVPNIAPLIVAQATILFGYAMVDLAAVSFLGLGVQPPTPNWGVMISENQAGILEGYPLPALAAGILRSGVRIVGVVWGAHPCLRMSGATVPGDHEPWPILQAYRAPCSVIYHIGEICPGAVCLFDLRRPRRR